LLQNAGRNCNLSYAPCVGRANGNDRQALVEDLVRLRRALRASPDSATELEPVIQRLRAGAGEGIAGAAAARVLGVSHTAVARWVHEGELLSAARKSSELDIDDLVDAVERLAEVRDAGCSRHCLSVALRERLDPDLRRAAVDSGIEPALARAWVRSGTIRHGGSGSVAELDPREVAWLRAHGMLLRVLHRAVLGDGNVDMFVLFGSAARGDDHASSDVDVLVDGPITRHAARMSYLRGSLVERLGRPVELMSLAEVRLAPSVLLGAVDDGRPIKDRVDGWQMLVADRERVRGQAEAERATHGAREAAVLASLVGSSE